MLQRRLEPEVMDTPDDARDYDSMDHAEVNRRFVDDLSAELPRWGLDPAGPLEILDLGAGTAQIPIVLAGRLTQARVVAVDLAESMLELGRENVARAELSQRVELVLADAKRLPFSAAAFDLVISNSIVHHIPEPGRVFDEALRVTRPGGGLFFRDLRRPDSLANWQQLVDTYAAGCNRHQRQLFADSLLAALSWAEVVQLIGQRGFSPSSVTLSSDRHWTWAAGMPAPDAV